MIKTVFVTVGITISALAFAGAFFLNTVLGMFGLVATTADTMEALTRSHQIVESLKSQHSQKRMKVTKRFAKRATKRVAGAAAAAATIGTVAVAATMVGLEVEDYCEEKEDLNIESNILYGTSDEFDFKQCIASGLDDSKTIMQDVKASASIAVAEAFSATKDFSSEKWEEIKAASGEATQAAKERLGGAWASARSLFRE